MHYLAMLVALTILTLSGKLFTVGGAIAAVSLAFVLLREKQAQKVCVLVSVIEIVHAIA